MNQMMRRVLSNEFVKGGAILTASSFIVNFLNYLFYLIVGRVLGPTGYGEIATLFSYITIMSIPTSIVTTIIIQKIGATNKDKTQYARAIESFLYVNLKKYWYVILLSLVIIPFIPRITNLSPFTSYTLIPIILIAVMTSIYNSILQGLKLFWERTSLFLYWLRETLTALNWPGGMK